MRYNRFLIMFHSENTPFVFNCSERKDKNGVRIVTVKPSFVSDEAKERFINAYSETSVRMPLAEAMKL